MTTDFLLEIGTEEIPARMLPGGMADLERLLKAALEGAGLAPAGVTALGTPRRLAVICEGLPDRQADREEVATGPSVSAAFGPDGAPTKAAIGFAKGQGVDPSALERVKGPKGEVVAVRKRIAGRATKDVLAELVPATLAKLAFPKAMRWESHTGPFVRPVHWIVALLGGDVVPFEFCGVKTGRATRGHRFLHPEPVDLDSPGEYESTLAANGVKACPDERKDAILRAMAAAEKELGCTFLRNDALLSEVANLIESPVFAVGSFDPDFLRLPPEVPITAMEAHLRYFPMVDAGGKLLNRFGVVSNTKARDMAVVVRGNERVLAARLYDARFFYRQDRKNGLEAMRDRLPERLFLKGVGDMAQKSAWARDLALRISDLAGLDAGTREAVGRAAELCKADLMSSMVGEFPELQGIMGAYYARGEGEPETPVATAIREHYLPRFSGDAIPSTPAGAVLAVADRVDGIVRCFGAGVIPTGSKDPLALRRAAIGAIRILMGRPELHSLTLRGVIDLATTAEMTASYEKRLADALLTKKGQKDARLEELDVATFFEERFRNILIDDLTVPADFANSVIGFLTSSDGAVPPAQLVGRAQALRDFAAEASDFRDFLDNVFKRVLNILKQAEEKLPGWTVQAGGADLLNGEKDYHDGLGTDVEKAVEAARHAALGAYHAARETGAYHDFLAALYSFKEPLAAFFGTGRDGVPVVIEEDAGKRLARLALLERVFDQFAWFADFSKISTR
jgi:glycyl-tRNA synthetase beta chain